jgi:hypothetical protein
MINFEIAQSDVPEDITEKRPQGRPKLPQGTPGKRKTIALQTDILKTAISLILDQHYSQTEVFNYMVKTYDISRQDASRYWKKAWTLIRDKFAHSKDEMIKKHMIKLWNIHDDALSSKDYTNARNALNDIAKLVGLNSPDKIEHTHQTIKLNFGNTKIEVEKEEE